MLNWIRVWLRGRQQRVVVNGEVSNWKDVLSGVPQGSVLGPVLFTIFINDLDEGIRNKILKFADDTKLVGAVGTIEEVRLMREDVKKLEEWSNVWQLKFNGDKCKVLHFGKNNKREIYEIDGKAIGNVKEEKDLGVIITENFKAGMQCKKAASKGNQVLGMIARSFSCKNKKVIVNLYKCLVRPHLDYCIQAWRPHLRKDIFRKDILEKVQRRALRMIQGCKNMCYEKRLKYAGLTTLETRMRRADLLEVYKIFKGLEGVNENAFFIRDKKEGGVI